MTDLSSVTNLENLSLDLSFVSLVRKVEGFFTHPRISKNFCLLPKFFLIFWDFQGFSCKNLLNFLDSLLILDFFTTVKDFASKIQRLRIFFPFGLATLIYTGANNNFSTKFVTYSLILVTPKLVESNNKFVQMCLKHCWSLMCSICFVRLGFSVGSQAQCCESILKWTDK